MANVSHCIMLLVLLVMIRVKLRLGVIVIVGRRKIVEMELGPQLSGLAIVFLSYFCCSFCYRLAAASLEIIVIAVVGGRVFFRLSRSYFHFFSFPGDHLKPGRCCSARYFSNRLLR